MSGIRSISIVVAAHLVVALIHGAAHGSLAINPPRSADLAFIVLTVYLGPLVAVWRLRAARSRSGAMLLALSMAGAFVYGIVFHYGLPTLDHVSQVPVVPWGTVFRITAGLLAPLEAIGALQGLAAWRAARPPTFTGAPSAR